MKTNIATTQKQTARLLQCGVSADTADMHWDNKTLDEPFLDTGEVTDKRDTPAWSLSRLLGLLPFKIHSGKYEYWLDIAPMDYGRQWSIGYYCMDKPRVIKGLTHTDSLIECAVQEIEWLTANGYKLNEI
jgi:hypothetical protein|nr:MAG TPA: hypothetical protein [Caudoviricetes sp.]